jgi:hypothetical protein
MYDMITYFSRMRAFSARRAFKVSDIAVEPIILHADSMWVEQRPCELPCTMDIVTLCSTAWAPILVLSKHSLALEIMRPPHPALYCHDSIERVSAHTYASPHPSSPIIDECGPRM